jgi:hypothetical protein
MDFPAWFGVGVLGFLTYEYFTNNELVNVVSRIDGKEYQVRNLVDKQEAADLMAKMNQKVLRLIEILKREYGENPITQRVVSNYTPNALSESLSNSEHTSYAVNKGEKLVFCMREKDERQKLVDENLMTFVTIHEVGHLGTKSVGHTPEFWDTFKFLLEIATVNGLYKADDYSKNPQPYCGMDVTTTPLDESFLEKFNMTGSVSLRR